MNNVVKESEVPEGDYLAPPQHVVTEEDKLQWLKIMFESQCPFVHVPRCSSNTIYQIKQAKWAEDYSIFDQITVSDCWFVKKGNL
jgi:hypothetical protein